MARAGGAVEADIEGGVRTMKAARISMTYALLAHILKLPEDAQIRAIWSDPMRPRQFHFVVEHDDLPEVEEGCTLPEAVIVYNRGPETELAMCFEQWSVQT